MYQGKSEFCKNVEYSCAVLTTTDCCVYTRRHQSSLLTVIEEKKKMHCCQVFPFSITFDNLKNRLLNSLFNIQRQSRVARTKLLVGDCREDRLKVFHFRRRSCQEAKRQLWGKHDPNEEMQPTRYEVWSLVVVFQFIFFETLLVLKESLLFLSL